MGIVIDIADDGPIIAESTFPFSKATRFAKFIGRSKDNRVEVMRLNQALTEEDQAKLKVAAQKRMGKFYDTGFNLHSRKQFCSRYVHEVISEALDIQLGKIEDLKSLFLDNPKAGLKFWRFWYFGRIPWQRETITPASLLNSPALHTIFEYSS